MNPVMIQHVSRADRYDHARQLKEIRLLNQADSKRRRESAADSDQRGASQALLPMLARRLRAWVGGSQEQALAADHHS